MIYFTKNKLNKESTSEVVQKLDAKGFTLLELLVVIMLVSVLTGVVLGVLNPAGLRSKARDNQRSADLRKIQTALEAFFADYRGYPKTAAGVWVRAKDIPGLNVYLNPPPSDPLPTNTGTNPCVTNGADYLYRAPATGTYAPAYDLTANMENPTSVGLNACPSSICGSAANCFSVVGPAGFTVPVAACPDTICNGSETWATCPADCHPTCPDTFCNGTETWATCPNDCPAACPDGYCNGSETVDSCPADCFVSCTANGEACNANSECCSGLCDFVGWRYECQ